MGNGDTLSGTFEKGLLQGDATIEYANGDRFVGKFNKGTRVQGEFRGLGGLIYTGEFKDDNANGKGNLVAGASRYDGLFEAGEFKSGEHRAADGTVYSGAYEAFRLCGSGTAKYADGSGSKHCTLVDQASS